MNGKSWAIFIFAMACASGAGYYQSGHKQPGTHADAAAKKLNVDRIVLRPVSGTDEEGEVRRKALLLGCEVEFIVEAPGQEALTAIAAASEEMKKLEKTISSWHPGSDVSRLNESAGVRPVSVSKDTLDLLKLAKQLNHDTDGALNITIGPVWNLWPFAHTDKIRIPTSGEIKRALDLVDIDVLVLDENLQTAFLEKKGMLVNMGAIAQGFAADRGIQVLRAHGIKSAAINVSGEIYLLGNKKSAPWQVDIENPRWQGRVLEKIRASEIAIATSSDSRQYVMDNGKRYGHILDPDTGIPVDQIQSVTILAPNTVLADAYATAVFVMGPEKGMAWVEAHDGVHALIVDAAGVEHRSSGWQLATNQE